MLFKIFLLFILHYSVLSEKLSLDGKKPKMKIGKCMGLWRPEKLPGRCFGLKLHHTYKELQHIKSVNSSSVCKALCCNLDTKCASWQYELYSKECKLGWILRLGGEAAGVPGWCEPVAPMKWNGDKVSRNGTEGVCTSGERQPVQCFGLGPERRGAGGSRLTTSQCAEACCSSSTCTLWQEAPGKGCFYTSAQSVGCDDKAVAKYEGGRKCLPGYCGGLEHELLRGRDMNVTISAELKGQ